MKNKIIIMIIGMCFINSINSSFVSKGLGLLKNNKMNSFVLAICGYQIFQENENTKKIECQNSEIVNLKNDIAALNKRTDGIVKVIINRFNELFKLSESLVSKKEFGKQLESFASKKQLGICSVIVFGICFYMKSNDEFNEMKKNRPSIFEIFSDKKLLSKEDVILKLTKFHYKKSDFNEVNIPIRFNNAEMNSIIEELWD